MAHKAKGSRPSAVDPSPQTHSLPNKLAMCQALPDKPDAVLLALPFQLAHLILDLDEDNGGSTAAEMILPAEQWAELVDLAGQILESEGIDRLNEKDDLEADIEEYLDRLYPPNPQGSEVHHG